MTDQNETTDAVFDPAKHKVDEVIAYVEENPEQADVVAEAEEAGKGRTTIAEALEEVKRPERRARGPRKPKDSTLVLEAGDSPSNVARRFLGRASRAREIVALNPGVKWSPGVEIKLPEVD